MKECCCCYVLRLFLISVYWVCKNHARCSLVAMVKIFKQENVYMQSSLHIHEIPWSNCIETFMNYI